LGARCQAVLQGRLMEFSIDPCAAAGANDISLRRRLKLEQGSADETGHIYRTSSSSLLGWLRSARRSFRAVSSVVADYAVGDIRYECRVESGLLDDALRLLDTLAVQQRVTAAKQARF